MPRKATSNDSVFLVLLKNFKGLKNGDQVFYRPHLGNYYVLGNVTKINRDANSINIDYNTRNTYAKVGKILMLTNEFDQESHDNPSFTGLTNTNSMGASNYDYEIKVNKSNINTTHLVITTKTENGKQYFYKNRDNKYVLSDKTRISNRVNIFETILILVNGDVFNKNFVGNKTNNLFLFQVS